MLCHWASQHEKLQCSLESTCPGWPDEAFFTALSLEDKFWHCDTEVPSMIKSDKSHGYYHFFFKKSWDTIGHVLNEQWTGYEHIFSWYEHSISIELKIGHIIWKSIQKLGRLPNLMVIGLNPKAWYTFKIRELSMDWRTPVPPIHTKCTMPLGLNQ